MPYNRPLAYFFGFILALFINFTVLSYAWVETPEKTIVKPEKIKIVLRKKIAKPSPVKKQIKQTVIKKIPIQKKKVPVKKIVKKAVKKLEKVEVAQEEIVTKPKTVIIDNNSSTTMVTTQIIAIETFEKEQPFDYEGLQIDLLQQINENKVYPYMARKKHYEGIVTIKVVIKNDGSLRHTILMKSSGYSILDNNALDLVSSAFPIKQFKGEAFNLIFPLEYSLNN